MGDAEGDEHAEQPSPPTRISVNFQVPPPKNFSFKAEEWQKWICRFERFRKATGLDKQDEENQVSTLVYTMGEEAEDIFTSFELSAEESASYETVKQRFEAKFTVKKNVIFERAKFNSRIQEENESVDGFITDLYRLSQHCEFQTLRDELIRDRIVVGIRDRKLSEKLQLDPKLTLETAVRQVKQSEMVKKQQNVLHNSTKNQAASVDRVRKIPTRHVKSTTDEPQKPKQIKCTRCMGPQHDKKDCPAKDSKCKKCSKKGHWAKACRSKSTIRGKAIREVHASSDDSDSDSEEPFFGEIVDIDTINTNKDPMKAVIHVNGEIPLDFKIDTGADVTVIPEEKFKELQLPGKLLETTNKVLMGPCKYRMKCVGKFKAQLHSPSTGKTTKEEIYVVKDLERCLLGRKAAVILKLIMQVESVNKSAKVFEKYPELFTGLGRMSDEYSYTISLKKDAKPFAVTVPRKVPLPLYKETKKELEKMEKTGVISRVEEPTQWCAPMVVTPKSNGKVRVCVDLTTLNQYVERENHPLPAVETTLARLSGAVVFTKLDANSGFWQVPLSEESRHLTTFITPWGRYRFNVLPYGISSGSEKFQKTMNYILEGVEGVECSIDDVLVHGASQEQHDENLEVVLQRIKKAGMTLNKEKCVFSVPRVKFLGHIISSEGIEVDPDKVKAIQEIPPPKNVQEVRMFLGMVNQLSKFTEHLAEKTKPIRDLLLKDSAWVWGTEQQRSFEQVKKCLIKTPVLAMYDPNKETKISADASSYGLGGVVLQRQLDDTWRPVSYISRALTPTETKYAQIEKELLALTWACERSSEYIVGKSIYVETDHKPLVPILTTHTLDRMSPRIQRLRMRLMRYSFKEVKHIPGKEMYVADTLSRLRDSTKQDATPTIPEEEMNAHVASVIQGIPMSDVKLQQMITAQQEDEVCRQLRTYTMEGWPEKQYVNDIIKPYWTVRDEIAVVQNLLVKANRIVVPSAMRMEVLDKIHEGHQGITKCRARAKSAVWWPGLSREIQDMVENCKVCARLKVNKAEPLIPTPFPERPWQRVATDLFELKDMDYLLVIDYFSRYVEVAALSKSKKSSEVIRALKSVFARHGIPEEVRSDNGPQYSCAEFSHFAKTWGFKHVTSSPRFPQSNGEVERGVRTVKSILKKEKDQAAGMLAYRSTPLACGYSPAELLMGRKIRTPVPMYSAELTPKWPDLDKLKEREDVARFNYKRDHDKCHRVTQLSDLEPGEEVLVTDQDQPAVVLEKSETPRSYVVKTPNRVLRRNRKHLTPIPPGNLIKQQQQPAAETSERADVPQESKKPEPRKEERAEVRVRPKREWKPSLKARENLGLV